MMMAAWLMGKVMRYRNRNVAPGPAQSAELGGTRLVMRMMPPHSGQAGASLRSALKQDRRSWLGLSTGHPPVRGLGPPAVSQRPLPLMV